MVIASLRASVIDRTIETQGSRQFLRLAATTRNRFNAMCAIAMDRRPLLSGEMSRWNFPERDTADEDGHGWRGSH
jgi:hypothetical protein